MRALGILLVLLSATASAEDGESPRSARPGRKARAPSGALLRGVEPSAAQCATLSGIARRADAARSRFDLEKGDGLAPFRDALLRLREEVVRDRGLDPVTMKNASSLKDRLKRAQTDFLKELASLEQEALATLTPAQRERLAGCPDAVTDDLSGLRREIAEIDAELHGEATPFGRWLATPGVADALLARSEGRARPATRPPAEPLRSLEREVRDLRHEINLWNLVNGLHLAEPQLATLAGAARRGEDACARALAALGPEQHDVLFRYNPCLVPPRDLRDPVRAGQADDASGAEKLLAKLRRMPANRYARDEERILDTILRGIEAREGRFAEDERIWALLLLGRTVRTARAMDDVEFQARAGDCAADLAPLFRLRSMKETLRDSTPRDAVLRQKARAFLLDPVMARVCGERLARLRAGEAIVSAGTTERAERCPSEGECGRP